MRERVYAMSQSDPVDDEYDVERPALGTFMSRLMHGHLREWLMVTVVTFAVGAVMVNALFLQTGRHPAPIFANRPLTPVDGKDGPMVLPRPRPIERKAEIKPDVPVMPTRSRAEIVADIQRELAVRGFYDGPADGIYGAKTDIAIRDFEHTASLRPSPEPNESLRQTIARSNIKAPLNTATRDPIANVLSPSKRVIALQRALADFGYGQIRATGQHDQQTRAAIEEFERTRKLPVTGQISDRVTRELALVTGRPLE